MGAFRVVAGVLVVGLLIAVNSYVIAKEADCTCKPCACASSGGAGDNPNLWTRKDSQCTLFTSQFTFIPPLGLVWRVTQKTGTITQCLPTPDTEACIPRACS